MLCFVLVFLCDVIFAQRQFFLSIKINDVDAVQKADKLNLDTLFSNSSSLEIALQNWQKKQLESGFLTSNIDKIEKKDSIYYVQFFVGKKYEWAKLRKGNIPLAELDKIGFRERFFSHKILNYSELAQWLNKIITYQENHGFPFAYVKLDSVDIVETGKITANLKLTKGKLVHFGTIKLEDDSTGMSVAYITRYLDILPNTIFDKSKVKSIKQRLRELPFLSLVGEPYLTFEDNKAIVHLTLKRVKASRFDALLGLLPQSNTASSDAKRFVLTGNLNLDLQNVLNKGERLVLDFQRFKPSQQQIKVQINYPYIANLPIGADVNLDIFRRDTAFTTIEYSLGGRYLFNANNFVKIYWQQTQNNLGKLNLTEIKANRSLPENLDVDASSYGIEFSKLKLDYRFNPRKGWAFSLKSDVGTRVIRKNNSIISLKDDNNPTYDFSILYDTLRLKSLRLQGVLQAEYYIPLFAQSTIKIASKASGIFAQTPVYQNEQYRIGGNRLLRGFDENSLYATRFVYANLEYRFLFGQNSYFSLFSDAAYTENITNKTRHFNQFLGFGVGMNFDTRAGIFSLSYALGKNNQNPIDLRSGKVHFGYLSLF